MYDKTAIDLKSLDLLPVKLQIGSKKFNYNLEKYRWEKVKPAGFDYKLMMNQLEEMKMKKESLQSDIKEIQKQTKNAEGTLAKMESYRNEIEKSEREVQRSYIENYSEKKILEKLDEDIKRLTKAEESTKMQELLMSKMVGDHYLKSTLLKTNNLNLMPESLVISERSERSETKSVTSKVKSSKKPKSSSKKKKGKKKKSKRVTDLAKGLLSKVKT